MLNASAPLQRLHSATPPAALPASLHRPSPEIRRDHRDLQLQIALPRRNPDFDSVAFSGPRLDPRSLQSWIVSPCSHSPHVPGFLSRISFPKSRLTSPPCAGRQLGRRLPARALRSRSAAARAASLDRLPALRLPAPAFPGSALLRLFACSISSPFLIFLITSLWSCVELSLGTRKIRIVFAA